jgi:hypothetical protein
VRQERTPVAGRERGHPVRGRVALLLEEDGQIAFDHAS